MYPFRETLTKLDQVELLLKTLSNPNMLALEKGWPI